MRELAPSGGRMRNRLRDKGWAREPNEGAGDWEMDQAARNSNFQ